MSMRFQKLALILGAATVIFLGSRVCSRLLAQAPPPPMPGGDYTQPPQPAQPSGGNQAPAGGQAGPEVLTRGPIHEAFAEVISYNPQPGQIVAKEPPKAIEEVPPAEKPEGDYAWIPGYWAWDQDRDNFIWVTGAWRIPPPGDDLGARLLEPSRQRISMGWRLLGTGGQHGDGQRVDRRDRLPSPTAAKHRSGRQHRLLPRPTISGSPATGIGSDGRYVWRAGYWGRCQPDWVWIPARYVWTPGGYVFVAGHWDYALAKRGVVFCPVYYANPYYIGPSYYYTPERLHPNPGVDRLFVLPSGLLPLLFRRLLRSDVRGGGHLSVVCGPRARFGYEPLFVYDRWYYGRRDPGWEMRMRGDYEYRVAHIDARPPHTYAAALRINVGVGGRKVHARRAHWAYCGGRRGNAVRTHQHRTARAVRQGPARNPTGPR